MIAVQNAVGSQHYRALRAAVDTVIVEAASTIEPLPLRQGVLYTLEGGKRVRPVIGMLMCGAVGGKEMDALAAGAAIEMLHTSSLVHDDIMDRSEQRRGRQTLHRLHGIPAAVLAGDTLLALGFRLMHGVTARESREIMGEFIRAFLEVCEGQGLDLHLEGRNKTSPELHHHMVEKKTARLMEAAAAIGARLGTADSTVVRGAATFGRDLGMAFQAHDDLLDAVGEEQTMGKPAGIDRRNGKQTYLTLAYPVEDGTCTGGSISATRELVLRYTETACAFLDTLPPTASGELLRAFVAALAERRS